jgi:hypothetical protein
VSDDFGEVLASYFATKHDGLVTVCPVMAREVKENSLCDDRPHPDLLPQGEGTAIVSFRFHAQLAANSSAGFFRKI